jgi:hypothetical protein
MGRLIKVCDDGLYDMGHSDDGSVAHTCHIDARHAPSDATPKLLLCETGSLYLGRATIKGVARPTDDKFSTAASINLMGYNDLWADGEIIPYGSERWTEIMSNSTDACDGYHATEFALPSGNTFVTDYVSIDGRALSGGATTITYMPHGEGLYIKNWRNSEEPKMRKLYQVFIIDLRTDEIEEFQCIATSERSAELKAIAAQGIIDEVDNYQIVVRALANVAERIEIDDK